MEQAQSVVLMHRALDKVKEKWEGTREELKQKLKGTHPVKSRIGSWMRDKMHKAEVEKLSHKPLTVHQTNLQRQTL